MDENVQIAQEVSNEEILGEQYPLAIKDNIEKIEDRFEKLTQKQLVLINKKILKYTATKFEPVKSSVKQDLEELLPVKDFMLDLKVLIPAIMIGVIYQQQVMADLLEGNGVNLSRLSARFGVDFTQTPPPSVFADLLGRRTVQLANVLRETTLKSASKIIAKGLEDGKTFEQMADALSKKLGFSGVRANKIARTEANYALNEGTREYVASLGVKKLMISLAVDACQICQAAATREYSVKERGVLPLHPNDRCIWISVIPQEWLALAKSYVSPMEQVQKDVEILKGLSTIEGPRGKRGPQGGIPVYGEDYLTESEQVALADSVYKRVKKAVMADLPGEMGIDKYLTKGAADDMLAEIQLTPGVQGKQGDQGVIGKMPIKGVDYFTKEDIDSITRLVKSKERVPRITKTQLDKVVQPIRKRYQDLKKSFVSEVEIERMILRKISDIQILTPVVIAGKNINIKRTTSGTIINVDSVLKDINAIEFTVDYTPKDHKEGRTYFKNGTLNIQRDIIDVVLQVGEENQYPVRNVSGAMIPNGSVVYVDGAEDGRLTVQLALADAPETAERIMGLVTNDIDDEANGYITIFGAVRDIDTNGMNPGDVVYLSNSVLGGFTNVRPLYPNYIIELGSVGVVGATDGEVVVNLKGTIRDILQNAWNATILEPFDFTVGVVDGQIKGFLEQTGGGDLTLSFSTGFTRFVCTPSPCEVNIDPGLDPEGALRLIYIDKATKTLQSRNASYLEDWPSGEITRVARIKVGRVGDVQTFGAWINQNINDHLAGSDLTGHITHISMNLRRQPARWVVGVDPSITIITNGGALDDAYYATTIGQVSQLHIQGFDATNMQAGDDVHLTNDFTDGFKTIFNLNEIDADSNGDSLLNRFFWLVFWGTNNKTGQPDHISVNLPNGSYTTQSSAEADTLSTKNTLIGADFLNTGFLISAELFQLSSAGGGTITHIATGNTSQDLRGFFPNTAAGSGGGSGVTTYLGLTDTSNSYIGQAGLVPTVNIGETALEFTDKVSVAGDIMTGPLMIDGSSDVVQSIIQIHSTQTSNAWELQESGGGLLGKITGSGAMHLGDNFANQFKMSISDTVTVLPSGGDAGGIKINWLVDLGGVDYNKVGFGLQFAAGTAPGHTGAMSGVMHGVKGVTNHFGPGLADDMRGATFQVNNQSTGDIVNAYDLYLQTIQSAGGGSVENGYGLYIESQINATNNFGVWTFKGLNRLGDQLCIDGSQDIVQLRVKGHSTQTENPFELVNSADIVQHSLSNIGGAIFNVNGNNADYIIRSNTNNNMFVVDGGTDEIKMAVGTKSDGWTIRDVVEKATTNASTTTLDAMALLDENTYEIEATIIGVESDGSNRATYRQIATVYRTGGGVATLQGAITVVHEEESDVTWVATINLNGNNVRVRVTGVAGTTIQWTCIMKYLNLSN